MYEYRKKGMHGTAFATCRLQQVVISASFFHPCAEYQKKNIFFDITSAITEVEMEVKAMKGAAWQGCQALGTGKHASLKISLDFLMFCSVVVIPTLVLFQTI